MHRLPTPEPGQPCETRILTTYFTQHKSDWQREGARTKVKYKYTEVSSHSWGPRKLVDTCASFMNRLERSRAFG